MASAYNNIKRNFPSGASPEDLLAFVDQNPNTAQYMTPNIVNGVIVGYSLMENWEELGEQALSCASEIEAAVMALNGCTKKSNGHFKAEGEFTFTNSDFTSGLGGICKMYTWSQDYSDFTCVEISDNTPGFFIQDSTQQ